MGAEDITTVTIRTLADCPQHLEQVAHWHHQEWRSGTLDQRRQRLLQHLHNPAIPDTSTPSVPTSFVALFGKTVVASISVVHYQRLGQTTDSLWLANLFVAPECRRQGIGEQMLAHAQHYARQLGVDKVYLYTTNLEQFYRQRGWLPVRRAEFRGEPVVIMRFTL